MQIVFLWSRTFDFGTVRHPCEPLNIDTVCSRLCTTLLMCWWQEFLFSLLFCLPHLAACLLALPGESRKLCYPKGCNHFCLYRKIWMSEKIISHTFQVCSYLGYFTFLYNYPITVNDSFWFLNHLKLCLYVCVCVWICAYECRCLPKLGVGFPWSWYSRWLWMVGVKLGCSGKTVCAVNGLAISLTP